MTKDEVLKCNDGQRVACPACRGYGIESLWCCRCGGLGFVIKSRSVN